MKRTLVLLFCFAAISTIAQEYNGLIPYRKDSLWGYADATGKLVVQPQFKIAAAFGEDGLAKVQTSKGYQLIDKKGKILSTIFGDLGGAWEGLRMAANENKKWGYVDAKGNWIIKPAYTSLGILKNGIASAKVGSSEGFVTRSDVFAGDTSTWLGAERIGDSPYFIVREKEPGKFSRGTIYSVVNKNGAVIKKLTGYSSVKSILSSEHLLALEVKYSTSTQLYCQVIDITGNTSLLTNAKYKSGKFLVAESKDGWGILDNKGEWKMNPVKGLEPVSFNSGYAIFRNGRNYMIVDSTGKEIAKDYSYISSRTQMSGLFSGKKTGQVYYEIMDSKGNVLDTCQGCITMEPLPGNVSIVSMNDKNYVRAHGGKLLSPGVDFISHSKEGYALINYGRDTANRKIYSITNYGFYSPAFKEVVPMNYSSVIASFIPGYLYLTSLDKKVLGYMHIASGRKFWMD